MNIGKAHNIPFIVGTPKNQVELAGQITRLNKRDTELISKHIQDFLDSSERAKEYNVKVIAYPNYIKLITDTTLCFDTFLLELNEYMRQFKYILPLFCTIYREILSIFTDAMLKLNRPEDEYKIELTPNGFEYLYESYQVRVIVDEEFITIFVDNSIYAQYFAVDTLKGIFMIIIKELKNRKEN